MTVKISISHDDRLVSANVTEKIQSEDIRNAYAEMTAQDALSYRKLVNLNFAPLEISISGIALITQVVDAAARGVSRGPAAFVVNRDVAQEMVEVFNRKSALDRPPRIFRDMQSAMRWLDEVAPSKEAKG